MFYNELSAKYLFWTCQGNHSVFFLKLFLHAFLTSDPEIQLVFSKQEHLCMFFFAKIVVVSLIIHFENLGTAIFKNQFSEPSFELWSNLLNQPVKQLIFTRVAGLQSQRYTCLDQLSKQRKTAAVIIVEYNLPTNSIKIMILKNTCLKEHLLVTASKWRWFYDFQALWASKFFQASMSTDEKHFLMYFYGPFKLDIRNLFIPTLQQ